MSAPRTRDQAELANLLDAIAEQWLDLSQREIARKLGFKPGVVSALVARARRHGDRRLPSRPNPAPKPKPPPKVRVVRPVNARSPPEPPRSVTFDRLRPGLCRWPLNDAPRGETHLFLYCGAPRRALIAPPMRIWRTRACHWRDDVHGALRFFFGGFSDGALSRVANVRTKSRITSVFDRSSAAATRTRSWYSSSLIRKLNIFFTTPSCISF